MALGFQSTEYTYIPPWRIGEYLFEILLLWLLKEWIATTVLRLLEEHALQFDRPALLHSKFTANATAIFPNTGVHMVQETWNPHTVDAEAKKQHIQSTTNIRPQKFVFAIHKLQSDMFFPSPVLWQCIHRTGPHDDRPSEQNATGYNCIILILILMFSHMPVYCLVVNVWNSKRRGLKVA